MASSSPPYPACGNPGCQLCAQMAAGWNARGGVTWTAPAAGYASGGVISASGANYTAAYAPGGLVSSPVGYTTPASPSPGVDGFSSRDFEPAAGVVTGVRWWELPAPDLARDPMAADEHWPRQLLHGAQAMWQPGLNEGICLQGFPHPVPCEPCADGFWAFWKVQPYPLGGAGLPVLGVIEGSGRVLSGERGFRCQRARIVALHLDSLRPQYPQPVSWYSLGSGLFMQEVPENPSLPPDWLDAWRAVISDRLSQLYPDAKVYENRDTMLRMHPPDVPPPPPEPPRARCPWCTARMTAPELAAHAHRCPLRLP